MEKGYIEPSEEARLIDTSKTHRKSLWCMAYQQLLILIYIMDVFMENCLRSLFVLVWHGELLFCLELIHAALCGPIQTTSLGGSNFFLLSTDDYSIMSWV